MSHYLNFSLASLAAAVLIACGGGGGGGDQLSKSTSGVAVDGYLSGSTATCDTNGDGLAGSDEASVKTTTEGKYTFSNGCGFTVIVSGGTDMDTGNAFKGVLKAPAGATVATPLTTLLVAGVSQAQLRASLGFADSVDFFALDPAAKGSDGSLLNSDAMKKSLAVQQMMQTATDTFAKVGNLSSNASSQAIYIEVASAFATSLKTNTLNTEAGTLDLNVVNKMMKAATEKVATSNAVSSEVRTAVSNLNADAVATVAAAGIKAKAEAILNAPAGKLKEVTKTQQDDNTVADFVTSKKDKLGGDNITDADVLAWSESLTNSVKDASGPTTPTNYLSLVENAISLMVSNLTSKFTATNFASDAGISINWPMSSSAAIKLNLNETGSFAWADGQTVSAAVKISETGSGQGQVIAFIDNVGVKKTSNGLEFLVASNASAKVYGVSADGKKKAVIDFSQSVRGIRNTLAISSSTTVLLGDVINYAINNVSNDFTGINSLRGKYKVSLIVSNMPLRLADGSRFTVAGIDVPVELDSSGNVTKTKAVAGAGLEGFITLVSAPE